MKPGYRRLVGTLMSGGDPRDVEIAPGKAAEASLILRPALYFAGIVVDEHGKPIPGVKISANAVFDLRGSGGIERTASHSDGSFELFNYPEKPASEGSGTGFVCFFHPDYIDTGSKIFTHPAEIQRESLRVVLEAGHKVDGHGVRCGRETGPPCDGQGRPQGSVAIARRP